MIRGYTRRKRIESQILVVEISKLFTPSEKKSKRVSADELFAAMGISTDGD